MASGRRCGSFRRAGRRQLVVLLRLWAVFVRVEVAPLFEEERYIRVPTLVPQAGRSSFLHLPVGTTFPVNDDPIDSLW